jgi:hypothetical protein
MRRRRIEGDFLVMGEERLWADNLAGLSVGSRQKVD